MSSTRPSSSSTPGHTPRWLWPAGLALLLTLVAGAPARAQQADQEDLPRRAPAAFLTYRGAGWLERHEREQQERPSELVKVLGYTAGQTVADVGCGSGYMARKIAPIVGTKGKVYCVDIQQEMLDIAKNLAEREQVSGIVNVLSLPDDPKLPKGEIDRILLVDVYHEIERPEPVLARMRESLAPGGRVALVEYRVEDGSADQVKPDHRMSVRQVLAEWKPAGFQLVDLQEPLPMQHVFIFQAAGDAQASPVVADYDLVDAIAAGRISVETGAANATRLTLKVKRTSPERLVVTAPAGAFFAAPDGARDLVAIRDASIPLFDDQVHEWTLMAAGTSLAKPMPTAGQALKAQPAAQRFPIRKLMYLLQSGGLPFGVAQAALLIAASDAGYTDLGPAVQTGPVTGEQAIGLAMYFCDRAGVDITTKKIWSERERFLERIPDANLKAWLQQRAAGH